MSSIWATKCSLTMTNCGLAGGRGAPLGRCEIRVRRVSFNGQALGCARAGGLRTTAKIRAGTCCLAPLGKGQEGPLVLQIERLWDESGAVCDVTLGDCEQEGGLVA